MRGAAPAIPVLPAQRFLDGVEPPCRAEGVDPEVFFPHEGGSFDAARRICLGCTVRDRCADWAADAFTDYLTFGMWGGLTPMQLEALRQRRQRAARWAQDGAA